MKPRVCILKSEGTTTNTEVLYAFEKAGGLCTAVHLDQLREGTEKLHDYQILTLPGGYSGDEIHPDKVMAAELKLYLQEQLTAFVEKGKLILGIGSGFQVLTATGLLPFAQPGKVQVSLTNNASGRFHCRWVAMRVEQTNCVFTRNIADTRMQCQVAHGEGNFYAPPEVLGQLESARQIVFRYADPAHDNKTPDYPDNPNGSLAAVAGICDPSGRILGMMPHPERFVEFYHHPNWRRTGNGEPQGIAIFRNAVEYAAGS